LAALLIAGLAALLAAGTRSAGGDLSALSRGTGEVNAANDLYFRLNDMDAQAADALLVGFNPAVPVAAAVDADASQTTYNADRSAASADLERIAADPAAAGVYPRLLTDLGAYEALIAQALYVDKQTGDQEPAAPPAIALDLYEEASGQMHNDILPIARQITSAGATEVDAMYQGQHSGLEEYALLTALLGLATAAALGAAHLFITRRFRRMLTPALAAAVLGTLVVTSLGASALLHEATQLRVAKVEAFDSISALTDARAVSYDANADESRWLLDRTASLQQSFFTKVAEVASVPEVSPAQAAKDTGSYYAALNQVTGYMSLDASGNSVSQPGPTSLGGFLGSELDNITFPGEAQAAYATARAFNAYVQVDATVRSDATSSDLKDAVAVDIGTKSGESNYEFYQYDKDLQSVIAINQGSFNAAVANGTSTLGPWNWLPYAAGVILLLLLGAGVAPRLREYR
jgi:hypothetical protein